MSTTLSDGRRTLPETLNQLLAGLGFDAEVPGSEPELEIDRFDQWTNPSGAVLACTCTYWPGTDSALERVV